MPARLSLTKAQRDSLLVLPDTEEAFVRHYSFSGEEIEIIGLSPLCWRGHRRWRAWQRPI